MTGTGASNDTAALDAPRERLVVALDVPGMDEALALDRRLGEEVRWVKVGLELFTAAGPAVVRELRERGRRVFLDLKLHDIPNTVAGGVRSASRLGAELLTLHAEGGPAMMRAAVEARDAESATAPPRLRLLAVTVLTSLDGSEYPSVYKAGVPDRVIAFARAAAAAGVDGVVCSPLELPALASAVPAGFLRVTPGIRPRGEAEGDQARVADPAGALAAGASHLVVGRPITKAPDPPAAAREILRAMALALAG
jgi:orotidine-5'-phosphate decarboxylase